MVGPTPGASPGESLGLTSLVRLLPWDRSLRASSPSRWQHPGVQGLGKALELQYCSRPQDVAGHCSQLSRPPGHRKEQILCAIFFRLPRLTAHFPGDLAGRCPHCLRWSPLPTCDVDGRFWFCSVGDVERAIFLTSPSLQYAGGVRRPLITQVVIG